VLDLLKLKTFQVAAATNNFTRAATELGYSQSSVTTHIQALERELGAPLFDRVAKNVVLTEVGRRTLEYANKLLALADEAKAAVHKHGELSGPLSVGAPDAIVTYRLPEVLRQFQTLYPHVQLSLASGSDSEAHLNEVRDGTLDLAFIVDERVRSDGLITTCLGREDILIVKAPDYEFTTAGDFKLEDLASARILLTTKDCTFRLLFERVLGVGKVFLNNVLELGSIEAAKQCAMAGMGLAVLPKMALTAELKRNRLVTVPWSGPGFPVYAQVLRNRRRSPSPALDTLWNLAKQSFEAQSGRGRW
jgi:DNA-binding transcriptional LysR family regulator